MKLFFTISLIFVAAICRAQQKVYYLTNGGKYLNSKDSADFIRVISPPDSGSVLYNVAEFYKNGNQKTIGKSAGIDPPRYLGQVVRFFENGKRASLYDYGKQGITGNAFEFYPNGKLYRVLNYPDSLRIKTENHFAVNYLIMTANDSMGNKLVADGQGYYKGFDSKFKYTDEEGPIKNGMRNGTLKGAEKDLKLTFTETYDNGKLTAGNMIDSAGEKFSYTGTRVVAPQFTGGPRSFSAYVGNNIKYPDAERKNEIQGVVILQFVVEKDGSVTNIKVQKPVSPGLDNEALRVLKKSPLWVPGTRFGKPVRVTFAVPINFKLE